MLASCRFSADIADFFTRLAFAFVDFADFLIPGTKESKSVRPSLTVSAHRE
jgi:hypothetical protein